MREQFVPPFQLYAGGRKPVLRGVAMLCWIDDEHLRPIDPKAARAFSIRGSARGWVLAVEDRGGGGSHSFAMGPAAYTKYKARRTWDLELERPMGSTGLVLPAVNLKEELWAIEHMREHHVGGWLHPDWSLGEVTHSGDIEEYATFEAMLPRLTVFVAEFWARMQPRWRATIDRDRTDREILGLEWDYSPRRGGND